MSWGPVVTFLPGAVFLSFAVPINPGRGQNDRYGHVMAAHKVTKAKRRAVHLLWPWSFRGRAWRWPVEVRLTRIYPPGCRKLDDDNLAGAMKAFRDQVVKELGADDSAYQEKVRILAPRQERGSAWGVRIEVREVAP